MLHRQWDMSYLYDLRPSGSAKATPVLWCKPWMGLSSRKVLIWLRSGLETYNSRENNIDSLSCMARRGASVNVSSSLSSSYRWRRILLLAGYNTHAADVRIFLSLHIASLGLGVSDNHCNSIRLPNLDIFCIPGRS